ncbi:hypothetical protein L2E82_28304 [Cichorium intybus]|uniref:Uncharacterized protein n=1 Tax=Cichorium intybus TaxID=13427 RepID=A0ACB9CVR1_CICIN|nr:hypothetical protein L2E82_28304 [Cichorium intybus]
MVFYCRCFSFEDDKKIEHESRTQTKSTSSVFSNLARKPNNLRVFTVAELKVATNNFSNAWKIRDGRYGSEYKGMVKSLEHPFDKIPVTVKKAKGLTKASILSFNFPLFLYMLELQYYTNSFLFEHKDWLADVNFWGAVDHPNLVTLVGYCAEENKRGMQLFLIYKYMPNRSVRHHLSTCSETPLSWTMRLKVAQDAARGLAYLHEGMDLQIIFRDFKSSKLLLDDEWNAKLSDIVGMAQIGSQKADNVFVTYGAPEYCVTGRLSSKSDVWSYGVFLYELITGRKPLDRNRPQNEQKLLEWVRPYVQSKNLQPIIDPRLKGMCSLKSAQALATIAGLCLKPDPRSRLKMSEVLELVDVVVGVPSQGTSTPAPSPKIELVNVGSGVPSQVTDPAPASKSPVPVIRRSKLLKSWCRKSREMKDIGFEILTNCMLKIERKH